MSEIITGTGFSRNGRLIGNCVYIGYDENGLFKIGMTDNWQRRLRQIQNMNPNFQFLCVIPQDKPAITEASLHVKFASKRMVGEWFQLSAEDIKTILDMYLTDPPDLETIYPEWKKAIGQDLF